MGRTPCCDKAKVKRGPWSPEEDMKLKGFIEKNGTGGNWIAFPHKAGLKRCGKSCRLRWLNYLRPNIRHGQFSETEDMIICNLFASIGSRWSIIAGHLPGRTDNDIKNYWNTKLKKKLLGISPSQRKPTSSNQLTLSLSSSSSSSLSQVVQPFQFSPKIGFPTLETFHVSQPDDLLINTVTATATAAVAGLFQGSTLHQQCPTKADWENNSTHQVFGTDPCCTDQKVEFEDINNDGLACASGSLWQEMSFGSLFCDNNGFDDEINEKLLTDLLDDVHDDDDDIVRQLERESASNIISNTSSTTTTTTTWGGGGAYEL